MNSYLTGAVIRELRERNRLTQAELADRLHVSDKTVSKWETGKGLPDVTLLEPIADAFGISIVELFSGAEIRNQNVSANVLRTKFYVCPVCGNVIQTLGEAVIHCHGVLLSPAEAEKADESHRAEIEISEDEYYICIDHEMSKTHYISFVAALSPERVQFVKLYPEGGAEARVKLSGVQKLLFYCNRDGLYSADLSAFRRRPR